MKDDGVDLDTATTMNGISSSTELLAGRRKTMIFSV
jgi:hypothetical protein